MKRLSAPEQRFNICYAVHLQINCRICWIQKTFRRFCRLGLFLNQYPTGAVLVLGKPRNLGWSQVNTVAGGKLQFNKMKQTGLITYHQVGDTCPDVVFNSR